MNLHEVFIHIHQGCFAGTGAIVRLPQCQWSKPDGYGRISQCITTTKHSKAKTVCIFLGIYCMFNCSINISLKMLQIRLTTLSLFSDKFISLNKVHLFQWYINIPVQIEMWCLLYPPPTHSPTYTHFNKVYWFHLVCLLICWQNFVSSVSSTILARSISYLSILSSNFSRCVACKVVFKIQTLWSFGQFFKLVTLTLTMSCLLGIQYESIVWVIMGQRGLLRTQTF